MGDCDAMREEGLPPVITFITEEAWPSCNVCTQRKQLQLHVCTARTRARCFQLSIQGNHCPRLTVMALRGWLLIGWLLMRCSSRLRRVGPALLPHCRPALRSLLQAASDVNSPVTGTVKEVNEALNDEPNKVIG